MNEKEKKEQLFFMKCWNRAEKQQNFYAVKPCQTGRGNCQFWIERIHMEQDYLDYSYLDAVLQFIQYKCWCSGCTAMYTRISAVNLMDMERYRRYGFYVIAEQMSEQRQGNFVCHYVLKYPLPREWEEIMNIKERNIYYEGKR